MKYEIGDKVRVIESNYLTVDVGDIGVITDIHSPNSELYFVRIMRSKDYEDCGREITLCFYGNTLELVEYATPENLDLTPTVSKDEVMAFFDKLLFNCPNEVGMEDCKDCRHTECYICWGRAYHIARLQNEIEEYRSGIRETLTGKFSF